MTKLYLAMHGLDDKRLNQFVYYSYMNVILDTNTHSKCIHDKVRRNEFQFYAQRFILQQSHCPSFLLLCYFYLYFIEY